MNFFPKTTISKLIVFCIVFFCGTISVLAQPNFRKISPEGGLTFQGIRDIVKDKNGLIWISTQHGLFKFNSKTFTNYNHIKNDSLSLPHDNVTVLLVDTKSNFYIGTENGLCTYNYKQNIFLPVPIFNHQNKRIANAAIQDLKQDDQNNIWLIANNQLFIHKNNGFYPVDTELKDFSKFCFQNGKGFLGTNAGAVYRINTQTKFISEFIPANGHKIDAIFKNSHNLIAGYRDAGAAKYSNTGKLIYNYSFTDNPQWDIAGASVRDIIEDEKGNTWFASFKGLFIEQNGKLFRYSPENTPHLPHTSVYRFYKDEHNAIWVGTWSGGICYYHPNDNLFNSYSRSNALKALNNNIISSFSQLDSKHIFIGTEVGGINVFNKRNGTFHQLPLTVNGELAYNVKTLAPDKNNNIFAGTLKGLFIKKAGTESFKNIPHGPADGKHISGKSVYSLCPVDSGMWIGIFGNAINFYHSKTGKISYWNEMFPNFTFHTAAFRHIIKSKKGELWFATHNGVFRLNQASTPTFKNYSVENSNLRGNVIYYLFESSAGEIWMGTKSHGISIYNPENDSIRTENFNGLLDGKDVYAILEDDYQNIWITTNMGLFYYNPMKKIIRRFTETNGLQSNLYNPQAIFKDSDGTLYFGGTNGFSTIVPGNLKTNNTAPNIIINNILVNNTKHINYFALNHKKNTPELKLKYNETSIRLDFTADNYLLPENNRFQYRLKGFSNEWINNKNEGSAVFTNLSDGNYIFEVKACNNDGIWNEKPAQIYISVATPYWRSVWAYLVYTLLLSGIAWFIVRTRADREKLKKQVLIEKLEKQNQEDLNELKLQFFTNISHEFRTPLTLITGPLKKLIDSKEFSGKSADYLNVINRNANRLLGLVNQILDLRKVEKGKSILDISTIKMKDFINERFANFTQMADEKQINYNFIFEGDENMTIEADEEKLDKIIYNLLSNAFKYTPEKGTITIVAGPHPLSESKRHSNQLRFGTVDTKDLVNITVTDSGKGIQSSDLVKIFDRFEQGEAHVQGSGIGLALCQEYTFLHRGDITAKSTPGKGSSFQIRLPQKQVVQKILTKQPENLSESTLASISLENMAEDQQKEVIMVVEDNADLQNYLNDLLSEHFQVLLASNGKEGLKLLTSHNVDLIISDVMMPEMDGMDFCNRIKSNLETSHIPVILLTALTDQSNKISGFNYGADAYITKPFDEALLLSRITNLLHQRRRLRENFGQPQSESTQMQVSSLDNYFLNKIHKLVEDNLTNEKFTIEWLASEIGFSRSQLHRKLKNLTGSSSSEYIRMLKLKKAAQFLKSNQYNIDEAAFKAGFTSHSYFSKCFKELYKMSPKEFKQKYSSSLNK